MVQRRDADADAELTHQHPALVHEHEHYHISHHHRDNMVLGEWSHRESKHSHLHNHTAL